MNRILLPFVVLALGTQAAAAKTKSLSGDDALAIAIVSLNKGKLKSALRHFEKAVDLAATPHSRAVALSYLGVTHLRAGHPSEALLLFVQALRIEHTLELPPKSRSKKVRKIFRCAGNFTEHELDQEAIRKMLGPKFAIEPWSCPVDRAASQKTKQRELPPLPTIQSKKPPPVLYEAPQVQDEGPSPLQIGLLSAGGAALVAGGVLTVLALSSRSDFNKHADNNMASEANAVRSRMQKQTLAADILISTGVVSAVLGLFFVD